MTSQDLVVIEQSAPQGLQTIINTAFEFAQAATSKNTQRAYARGWKSFAKWCEPKALITWQRKRKSF